MAAQKSLTSNHACVQAASRRPETHVMWKTTTTAGPSYPREKLPMLDDLHAGALAAVASERAFCEAEVPGSEALLRPRDELPGGTCHMHCLGSSSNETALRAYVCLKGALCSTGIPQSFSLLYTSPISQDCR